VTGAAAAEACSGVAASKVFSFFFSRDAERSSDIDRYIDVYIRDRSALVDLVAYGGFRFVAPMQ